MLRYKEYWFLRLLWFMSERTSTSYPCTDPRWLTHVSGQKTFDYFVFWSLVNLKIESLQLPVSSLDLQRLHQHCCQIDVTGRYTDNPPDTGHYDKQKCPGWSRHHLDPGTRPDVSEIRTKRSGRHLRHSIHYIKLF